MDLIIIDGNSLANRAFYAMPALKNKNGLVCNAMFGFCNILVKLITENNPKYLAVAFDAHSPTFRHKMYEEYKAGRNAMPEDLVTQMPLLQDLLHLMNIKTFKKDGIEADDIIGTITKNTDMTSVIITGDKDLLQLVDDKTSVWLTRKGISNIEIFDPKHFFEVYGFEPSKMVDLKSMMGDPSDNIPGIVGVGEKTALDFMHTYGSLDGLYSHIEDLKGAKKDKVVNGKDIAYLSYELATINKNAEFEYNIEEMTYDFPFDSKVYEKFEEYEFSSLLKRHIFEDSAIPNDPIFTQANIVEINDFEQMQKIIKENLSAKRFSCHYEKYYDQFHFAFDIDNDYYFVTEKIDKDTKKFVELLIPFINDAKVQKTFFQYKKQKHYFRSLGLDINMPCFDVTLAQYLVDATVKFDIIDKAFYYLGLDIKAMASGILKAQDILLPELQKMDVLNLYNDIELKLEDVLFHMEAEGIKVDRQILENLTQNYSQQLDDIAQNIYTLVGEEFNINSTKQLSEILFEKLKLQLPKGKKRSTNVETLQEIYSIEPHPIIPLLMRYRKVAKICGTYLEGMLPHLDDSDIVHTEFNQTMAATGRLSSLNPNLQNIPTKDEEGKGLRKMFICKDENSVFVSADYSQIELRLLAHYSEDEKLVNAFKNNQDIHSYTASVIYNVPLDEVTPEMRRVAKTVNFGIVYGISDFGLSQSLAISRNQAKEFIESYFQKYEGVKQYMDNIISKAKEQGYVETMFGRKREIPELQSKNKLIQKSGERIAMNTPLQGSESDIIKIAMINVANELKTRQLQSKMILQIHDELILECPENEIEIVSQILKDKMENVVQLNVPLIVNISIGKTWYDV